MPHPCIGIWGHFGQTNLGDEVGPAALLTHLKARRPDLDFVLYSRSPEDSSQRYGYPTYAVRPILPPVASTQRVASVDEGGAWRVFARWLRPLIVAVRTISYRLRTMAGQVRFTWQSWHNLNGVDVLLVAGSNPIFDFFGGFWGFPLAVARWAFLTRIRGIRLAFVSVGAGPIESGASAALLRWSLNSAAYVSLRDEESLELLRRRGLRAAATLYPDLAWSLALPERAPRSSRGGLRVGINPMPVFPAFYWPVADQERYDGYVESLRELTSHVVGQGHHVVFFGTQSEDRRVASDVLVGLALPPGSEPPEVVMPDSVDELLQLMQGLDLAVVTRFHGAVLALTVACPVVAICYHPKTTAVMKHAGQDRFALDLDGLDAGQMRTAFDRLRDERLDVGRALRAYAQVQRARMDEQFDRLVQLLV